jgi:hypothetical protein
MDIYLKKVGVNIQMSSGDKRFIMIPRQPGDTPESLKGRYIKVWEGRASYVMGEVISIIYKGYGILYNTDKGIQGTSYGYAILDSYIPSEPHKPTV